MRFFRPQKFIALILIIVGLFFLTKYSLLKWGAIRVENDPTITVRGTYTMQIANQIATYNLGINSTNASKDTAVNEVKSKSDNLVKTLQDYGIAKEDIQTTAMSVYQKEEPYYDTGVQKFKKTDWVANTTITVTLRDITRVDDFSNKVYSADISDLNGPYFALDYNMDTDTDILLKALDKVNTKAKKLAESQGKKLGEVISITEEDNTVNGPTPIYGKMIGGGAGGGPQTGSSSVTKSVSVVYKLY